MFCNNCGKQVNEDFIFCPFCRHKLISDNIDIYAQEVPTENTQQEYTDISFAPKNTPQDVTAVTFDKRKIIKIALIILSAFILVFAVISFIKHNEEMQAIEREETILEHIVVLGDQRRGGSWSSNTADLHLAALFGGIRAEEKGTTEESGFCLCHGSRYSRFFTHEDLKEYFNLGHPPEWKYAILFFATEQLDRTQVEYLCDEETVPKSNVIKSINDLLILAGLDCEDFLYNEKDIMICYNESIRIKLTEQNVFSLNSMSTELYDFVFSEKGIRMIDEDILADQDSLEDIAKRGEKCFSGKTVYYDDLSTVGKLVFCYRMPLYLNAIGGSCYIPIYRAECDRLISELLDDPIYEGYIY